MSHVYQLGSLPHASQSRFHDSVRFSNKCDNRPVRSLSGINIKEFDLSPFLYLCGNGINYILVAPL